MASTSSVVISALIISISAMAHLSNLVVKYGNWSGKDWFEIYLTSDRFAIDEGRQSV
jgi:hypothetical protein